MEMRKQGLGLRVGHAQHVHRDALLEFNYPLTICLGRHPMSRFFACIFPLPVPGFLMSEVPLYLGFL